MSLKFLERACDPEIFDYEESAVSQGATEKPAVLRIQITRKDTDQLHPTPHDEYVLRSQYPANDLTLVWELLTPVTRPIASSLRDAPKGIPESGLPRPHMYGSPILDLGQTQDEQSPGVTQVANRQNRETRELSPEEQELRRPPSPFLLLDADHTRPDLPTNARIVHAISVP